MKTIPGSHKAKIEDIKERFTSCVIVSKDNDYQPKAIDVSRAWYWLATAERAKLVEEVPGEKYRVTLSPNPIWFELTLPPS